MPDSPVIFAKALDGKGGAADFKLTDIESVSQPMWLHFNANHPSARGTIQITAIFLPLGFLTGLFGINIGGMPGVDNNMAFALFSFGLFIIVFIQVLLFKLFKWF